MSRRAFLGPRRGLDGARRVAGLLALAVLGAAPLACASPIVGDRCRSGLTACAGQCVDLRSSAEHCGACGGTCAGEQLCVDGTCRVDGDGGVERPDGSLVDAEVGDGGTPDGSRPDAALPDGALPDGALADGSVPDGGTADLGPPPGCDLGELRCDDACFDPMTDPRHCGGCDRACDADEFCIEGMCEPACDPPLTLCGRACVHLSDDADHCGRCRNACVSGLCFGGDCVTPTVGHVVVIGHNYEVGRTGINRVVGNAVFLASGATVRVLVHDAESALASVDGTDRAIDQVATERGRSWTKVTYTRADDVPFLLSTVDAFLIYAQAEATDASLEDLGRRWARALETFLQSGGVVVLLEDASSANTGTYGVLQEAGVFTATGRVDISASVLQIAAPGDAVALGVPLTYRGETVTVRFTGTTDPTVVARSGDPVVIHRIVTP
ncbi:MAG: MXAN_6577-like cysteine-rich protein [Sandaracinaceae bacterium]